MFWCWLKISVFQLELCSNHACAWPACSLWSNTYKAIQQQTIWCYSCDLAEQCPHSIYKVRSWCPGWEMMAPYPDGSSDDIEQSDSLKWHHSTATVNMWATEGAYATCSNQRRLPPSGYKNGAHRTPRLFVTKLSCIWGPVESQDQLNGGTIWMWGHAMCHVPCAMFPCIKKYCTC